MKLNRKITIGTLAFILAMAGSPQQTQAQTIITNTFDFNFPTTSPGEAPFASTWLYWYNTPGTGNPIVDPTTWTNSPVPGGNTSQNFGSLEIISPFAGTLPNGTQNIFFGTFAEDAGNAYDFSIEANTVAYSNVSFDILVPATQPLSSGGNYGSIGVGFISSSYGYEQITGGSVTIPASASTSWYHVSVPIDQTQGLGDVPGIALDYANYSGYPGFDVTNWIANVTINGSTAPPPPPPTMLGPTKPVTGLNTFDTVPASEYNRYQIINSNDFYGAQLSWYGHPNVTYSYNIKQFPTETQDGTYSYQAHFFIVSGSSANETDGIPNQYDSAADYNLANCIFTTVQYTGNGGGVLNFRYKTNEIGGNGMLFNTTSPTNVVSNPNGWPIMPVATCTSASILGTWSLNFVNDTNITITAPDGTTTNFNLDPASAALFADPCSLILGSQPNNSYADDLRQNVIYSSFSATGVPSAYTDTFTSDSSLNTNRWSIFGSDDSAVVLVPSTAAYWVGWTLPATGYSLVETGTGLAQTTQWNAASEMTQIKLGPQDEALIATSALPGATQGYWSVVSNSYSQLVVVLPGQTFTPGMSPGYSGTPTMTSYGASGGDEGFTVYACDSHFNPVAGITDSIAIGDNSGGDSADPNAADMVNGVLSGEVVAFFSQVNGNTQDGSYNISASDASNPSIPIATSASFTFSN